MDFFTLVKQEDQLIDIVIDLLQFTLRYEIEQLQRVVLKFVIERLARVETLAQLVVRMSAIGDTSGLVQAALRLLKKQAVIDFAYFKQTKFYQAMPS